MKKISKKRKKHFSLKSEYKESFSFMKDSREFIYIAILGFFIFVAFGFFFHELIKNILLSLFNVDVNAQIFQFIEDLILQTEGMGQGELIGFIFFNNLQSSFFSMVLGIGFGLFPIIALILNGYLLGFVAAFSVESAGFWVLWRLLPHGIFELPAIFISLGLGLRLGFSLFSKDAKKFKSNLFSSLKVFLLIVFPLLVIAALIEGTLIFIGS